MLTPPPGWGDDAGESLPATTGDSIAMPALRPAPASDSGNQATEGARESLLEAAELDQFTGPSEPSAAEQSSARGESLSDTPPAPPAHSDPATFSGTASLAGWPLPLVVAGIGFALVAVLGLASLAMRGGGPTAPERAVAERLPEKPEAGVDLSAASDEAGASARPQAAGGAVVALKPAEPDAAKTPAIGEPAIEDSEASQAVGAEDIAPELPPRAPEQVVDEPVETSNSVAAAPAVARSFDPLEFDPLDLDAGSLDLILTRGGDQPAPPPAEQPRAENPTDDLVARLARVESEPKEPGADELTAELDGRLDGLAEDARAVVRRGPTGPPPDVVEEPLNVVIPEIQVANVSLARAYRLLADLAGTTITLDPAALRYAATGADIEVSIRGENQSIGELLAQVSGPVRLEVVPAPAGYVVRRVGSERRKAASYRVDDLLPADAENAEPLAALVKRMLTNLDAFVTADGAKLRVDGSAAAHMEVAIFCERLRKARGLESHSRYPRELLRTEPALAALLPALDRHATFTFVEFTPLAVVLDHWRDSSGLEILVDWASLADLNLGPSSTIACGVNDRPWRDALDAVLGDLDLSWRAVDERTIAITTKQTAAEQHFVEFYPAPSRAAADELAEILTAAGAPAVVYDEASRSVIASATAAVHSPRP